MRQTEDRCHILSIDQRVDVNPAGRIFKFAARRLGFSGVIPTSLMLPSERPKVSVAKRLPIFTPEQIEQTLAASTEPHTGRCSRSPP